MKDWRDDRTMYANLTEIREVERTVDVVVDRSTKDRPLYNAYRIEVLKCDRGCPNVSYSAQYWRIRDANLETTYSRTGERGGEAIETRILMRPVPQLPDVHGLPDPEMALKQALGFVSEIG